MKPQQASGWFARRLGRPRAPGKRTLAAALLAILALCCGSLLWRFLESGSPPTGLLDPASVSVDQLLQVFQETSQYLQASGWQWTQGTFEPKASRTRQGPLRKVRGVASSAGRLPRSAWRFLRRRLRRRSGDVEGGNATTAPAKAGSVRLPKNLQEFRKSTIKLSPGSACGNNSVRELHHLEAVMPGVEPKFLMEVMASPAYGVKWNPSVRAVVWRQRRHVRGDAVLPEVFGADRVRSSSGTASGRLLKDTGQLWDVTAQVSEIPIPRVLVGLAGRRFTADFIAGRFDCEARRGFTIATSYGTEAAAEAAGVEKGQELCMSTMMIAPVTGDWNGTRLHIVTHFDGNVPPAFRGIVNANVGKSLKALMTAMHRKALAVQATGWHPYIDCP